MSRTCNLSMSKRQYQWSKSMKTIGLWQSINFHPKIFNWGPLIIDNSLLLSSSVSFRWLKICFNIRRLFKREPFSTFFQLKLFPKSHQGFKERERKERGLGNILGHLKLTLLLKIPSPNSVYARITVTDLKFKLANCRKVWISLSSYTFFYNSNRVCNYECQLIPVSEGELQPFGSCGNELILMTI